MAVVGGCCGPLLAHAALAGRDSLEPALAAPGARPRMDWRKLVRAREVRPSGGRSLIFLPDHQRSKPGTVRPPVCPRPADAVARMGDGSARRGMLALARGHHLCDCRTPAAR